MPHLPLGHHHHILCKCRRLAAPINSQQCSVIMMGQCPQARVQPVCCLVCVPLLVEHRNTVVLLQPLITNLALPPSSTHL
jgi:hypothetical protein